MLLRISENERRLPRYILIKVLNFSINKTLEEQMKWEEKVLFDLHNNQIPLE